MKCKAWLCSWSLSCYLKAVLFCKAQNLILSPYWIRNRGEKHITEVPKYNWISPAMSSQLLLLTHSSAHTDHTTILLTLICCSLFKQHIKQPSSQHAKKREGTAPRDSYAWRILPQLCTSRATDPSTTTKHFRGNRFNVCDRGYYLRTISW